LQETAAGKNRVITAMSDTGNVFSQNLQTKVASFVLAGDSIFSFLAGIFYSLIDSSERGVFPADSPLLGEIFYSFGRCNLGVFISRSGVFMISGWFVVITINSRG
jgi:hypothetical protein